MNSDIIKNKQLLNYYGNSNLFLKSLEYPNFYHYRDLRQINNGYDLLTITALNTNWSNVLYSITSFPYLLLSLHEVYDNIIPGFNTFNVSTTAGNTSYTDSFLLNFKYNKNIVNLHNNGISTAT